MKWGKTFIWSFVVFATILLLATPSFADDEKPVYDLSEEDAALLEEKAEKFQFQTEVSRLMNLIINSLYRNKEIFLRELISNASDALDKIRFLSLTNRDILGSTTELSIKIEADLENQILHIVDTGIGMTHDELKNNLGTIAKSGTSDFAKGLEEPNVDTNLIGQFGVGFYSVFLVADKVTVTSKNPNDDQYIWTSTADSDFTIVKDPRGNTLGRGTVISLHFKPETAEFLDTTILRALIKKYSEFINFPIYLWTTKIETVEVPDEDDEEGDEGVEGEAKEQEEKDVEVEDVEGEESGEKKPKTRKVETSKSGFELINDSKPIWMRPISEVENEEYIKFYQNFFKQGDEPISQTHFKTEGEIEFRSVLFVPSKAPSNLYSAEPINDIKLFVRRVFITDTEMEPLLPVYLRFIKGVVDSDDLPLNVSRETLQQSKLLKVIKKKLTKKILEMLKNLADNEPEKYEKFWNEYSGSIKLGLMEDQANKKRLAKLLRYKSSESGEKFTSLDEYLSRFKKGQETIYFLGGSSLQEILNSPFLERLTAKGIEVLYLPDPIDEYTFNSLTEFEGKKFTNVAKDGLNVPQDEEESHEALVEKFKPLLTWMKEKLPIKDAQVSKRLTKSPCAIIAPQWGWTGNMERIMSSQAYTKGDESAHAFYKQQKRILEVNPKHPLILSLLEKVEAGESEEELLSIGLTLFDVASLRSSYPFSTPKDFAARVENLLADSLKIPRDFNIDVDEEKIELAGDEDREQEEEIDEDSEIEKEHARYEAFKRDEL